MPIRPRVRARTRTRKLALTALALAILAIAAASTFSAFTDTTTNGPNSFRAGTLSLSDNDGGESPMFRIERMGATDARERCIVVENDGTLTYDHVRLYGSTGGSGLAGYLTLKVERGSGATTFADCAGFTPDAQNAVVYNGPLSAFPTSYQAGVADPAPRWIPSERHTYKFTVATNGAPDAAQAKTAEQVFIWEAQQSAAGQTPALAGYQASVLADKPVHYFGLGEAGTSGGDRIGSLTTTAFPGSQGAALVINSDGDPARLVPKPTGTLTATSGSIKYAPASSYQFTSGDFTVELWVKPNLAGANDMTLIGFYCDNTPRWRLGIYSDGSGEFRHGGLTNFRSTSQGNPIRSGETNHFAATLTNGAGRVYINGVDVSDPRGTGRPGGCTAGQTPSLVIGGGDRQKENTTYDEVALYDKALTLERIRAHYDNGR